MTQTVRSYRSLAGLMRALDNGGKSGWLFTPRRADGRVDLDEVERASGFAPEFALAWLALAMHQLEPWEQRAILSAGGEVFAEAAAKLYPEEIQWFDDGDFPLHVPKSAIGPLFTIRGDLRDYSDGSMNKFRVPWQNADVSGSARLFTRGAAFELARDESADAPIVPILFTDHVRYRGPVMLAARLEYLTPASHGVYLDVKLVSYPHEKKPRRPEPRRGDLSDSRFPRSAGGRAPVSVPTWAWDTAD